MLLPYSPNAECPKCHWLMVYAEYFERYHGGCPEWGDLADLCFDLALRNMYMTIGEYVSQRRNIDDLIKQSGVREHFDRVCGRCGFSWVEETYGSGSGDAVETSGSLSPLGDILIAIPFSPSAPSADLSQSEIGLDQKLKDTFDDESPAAR